tara:strand:- start:4523 stop:5404 length:882 start_codon:yes stop_codon:yes gene_type:complete
MDNLKLLIEITRKNLILIFSVSLFSIVLGLWTYFLINPTFKSETTLYVQDKISISEETSISNIAGLSLGGISGLGGSGGVSSRYKTQLLSRKFIINFINKNNLKPYLFAVKSYDKESKQIIFDEKKYDPNKKVWIKSKRNKKGKEPSDIKSYKAFKRQYYQVSETQENFVKIIIFHISPVVAKDTLDLLIKDFNNFVQEEEVQKANEIISFLSEQDTSILSLEAKNAINKILVNQNRILALTLATENIAFVPIDPPYEEERKISPSGSIILFLYLSFSLFAVYAFLLIRNKFF